MADAIVKGITPEDKWQVLYDRIVYGTEHVLAEANSSGRLGHEYYNSIGYVPYDAGIHENVARTLEYAYDDWCILQIARKLNRPQEELDKWEAGSRSLSARTSGAMLSLRAMPGITPGLCSTTLRA